jgi:hypothetical protein
MSWGILSKIGRTSEIFLRNNELNHGEELKNSDKNKRMKAYVVYNPESNPHFYLHNKLNWYKHFD